MTKKIISLFLCLIMVLGFAAPAVQASETADGYVLDGTQDNVYFGDNVQLDNVVIDGNSVSTGANSTLPHVQPLPEVESPVFAGNPGPVDAPVCKCDECATIADHAKDCVVRAKYHKLCADTAENLFAVWGDYTADEQAYMLQYMEENFSGRYADLMKLLNAPTGSATEIYADGTTVSVEGIPQDGSLTVQEAASEVKDIVSEYMAQQGSSGTELFTYDVSVQDGEGTDWQPETNVKMELDMPGVKLHKYSKVYVVHVDDNGNASTIEAEVTEDGKVAFETPGFSTFAGFTVDFEYNGEAFSIKGMSEVLVSEVMDTLKMPLYIEDVANVAFTDESLVSVTAVEGDWLLTSLKAFDTEEKLTLTMKDGTEYVVNVTDAQFATTAYIYVGGTQADTDRNGECTWYLSGASGEVGYAYYGHNWATSNGGSYADGWSSSSTIEIRGPGTFQINLQHQQRSDYYDRAYWGGDSCALEVNIRQIKITNGAKLVFRLGSYFSGKEKSITIKGTADVPIFDIQDGSLYFCVSNNTVTQNSGSGASLSLPSGASVSYFGTGYSGGHIPVYLNGQDKASGAGSPLIYTHRGIDETDRQNLIVEDVTFQNAKHRAVLVQTNNMTNLCFTNCSFPSTVRDVSYGGGAIYIDGGTDGSTSNVVDVKNFLLTNCTFNGNSGASGHGGAIASYGDVSKLYVKDCSFTGCTSANRGGAIELSVNDKTATNYVYDWIKFENTTFTNCTASSHGGAIDISNGDNLLNLASSLTIEGCAFTNCKATGNRGGGIRMVVSAASRNLTINNTDFSGCTASSPGGGISIQGTIGNVTINNGSTFNNCKSTSARGGGVALKCSTVGNVTLNNVSFTNNTAGTLGAGFHLGINSAATAPVTVGDVSVTDCTFSNNTSGGAGASLSLTDATFNSITVQDSSFSNSYALNYGGGIAIKTYADDAVDKFPVKVNGAVQILDTSFDNCGSGGLNPEGYDHDGDPATANKTTWDHDDDPNTAEITRLNGIGGGGAIAIGGEIVGGITIKSTGSSYANKDAYPAKFINCYTWNNGGAVCFVGTIKTKKVDMKYVRFDGCRSRDAGNAVHISNSIIDDMNVDTCTFENCNYFTNDYSVDIPGTAYDSLGTAVHVAYDADGTFRCIGNTTCRAVLDNCTFTNNSSYSNGGGVYWNANNIRTGAGGTSIVPSLKIQNSTFNGNYAVRDGGALYVEATVEVTASEFMNNHVDGRGGAIAQQVYNNEARTLGEGEATNLKLDKDTSIHDNRAVHGGGISITVSKTVSVPDGTNVIYPVQFSLGGASVYGNKATGNGGGIYYSTTTYTNALEQREVDNFQKEVLIDNGLIYNNIAGYDDPDDGVAPTGGNGGGIYMSSNQVTTGTGTGYSKVSITTGSIYGNTANMGNGGGVYLTGKNALCTVTGGTVGGSTAGKNVAVPKNDNGTLSLGNGGGIAIYGGARIEMTGGTISYNEAYLGGGIAVREGSSMLSDLATDKTAATISHNKATSAGGGIAVHDSSWMVINGGTVSYNTAVHGGGISINGCYHTPTAATNPKFGMEFNGGIISYNTVNPETSGGTAYGGGICLGNTSSMKLNGGTVSYNKSVSADGTTYAEGQEGGGIAVCQGSYMKILGGDIMNNNAYDGGGMVLRGSSTVVMSGSMTVNISTDADTGIVTETVTEADGTIKNNTATNYGGGVYIGPYTGNSVNKFTLSDGWIYQNKATASTGSGGDGGGVYVSKYNGFYLEGGRVDENEATRDGGGIFCTEGVVDIKSGVMKQNKAKGSGGGIYCTSGTVTITRSTAASSIEARLEANEGQFGGAAFLNSATTTISGGIITKNKSNQGAGIFIRSGTATINGGTISYNECTTKDVYYAAYGSSQWGGGILVDNMKGTTNALVTINGGTIEHNEAPNGAGLWIRNINAKTGYCPTVVMNGGTISENIASGNGGGVFVDGGGYIGAEVNGVKECTSLTMNGGVITNNTANGNGGGVFVGYKAVVKITKGTVDGKEVIGTIRDNTAYNGGGVYVTAGGDLTVHEGHITYNKAVGLPSVKTGYQQYSGLKGAGGGICVANDSSGAEAKFTLTGENMAIYGNLADFAGDDVFANANNTTLTVPQVASMNLSGYDFKPEGWFEDYAKGDTKYLTGLSLGAADMGYNNTNFIRYRAALASKRVHILPQYVNGSGLASTAKYVNKPNTYVAMTLGIPAAADDTIVVDYDLSVKFDLHANDLMITESEFNSSALLGKSKPSGLTEKDDVLYGALNTTIFKGKTLTKANGDLKFGNATLTGKTVEYVMTTMNMTAEDSFYYVVGHDGPDTDTAIDTYYYAKVTVVPATTLYFEDNCGFVTYSGNWVNVDSDATTETDVATDLSKFQQDQDRPGPGIDISIDADNVYGYDSNYETMSTYSMGSAKKVTVSEGVDATATFTFTGTGFDVISLCSGDTGMVMVDIYKGSAVNDSNYLKSLMVDTYYGYTTNYYKRTFTYTGGRWISKDTQITSSQMGTNGKAPSKPTEGSTYVEYLTKLEPTTNTSDIHYQVPAIKQQGLDYGIYTVQIYVGWSWWTEQNRQNYDWCEFYLDAIRIYDPADNGSISQAVQEAYKADKEGWPVYQELRNMFITQENMPTSSSSGAVFIDGTSYNVSDYQNYGANNEVYLAKGQSIGFKLDELKYNEGFTSSDFITGENSIIAAIHIGAKSLKGSGKLTITDGTTTLTVEPGNTDMYYDISSMMNKVVTITNAGSNPVSITNVKVTHTKNPGTKAKAMNLLSMDSVIAEKAVALAYGEVPTPVLTPKYPTVSFEGEIRYNFYFQAENLEELAAERFGLITFTDNVDGTIDNAEAVIPGAVMSNGLLVVSTNGIPAKNLGDKLYCKIYAQLEDGSYVYSDLFSYSAVNYAKAVLSSETASVQQKTLVVAMLNYGAQAQSYFGQTTELMNSFVTDQQQALLSSFVADNLKPVTAVDASKVGSFVDNGGFINAYPTVSFEGAFRVQYYFTTDKPVQSNVTFYYWSEDTYNACQTLTADNADMQTVATMANGQYVACSPEIAAKDLDQTLYVAAVYRSEDVTYSTDVLAYSLASYCKTHAGNEASDMNAFANAAAIYSCAAKNYFEQ